MAHNVYFQSYRDYIWQWEENGEVIAIPGGNTIAYRPLMLEIIEHLAPQGLPPFGTLLMAVAATNARGEETIDSIHAIIRDKTSYKQEDAFIHAINFLRLLSQMPPEYKQGEKRLLLLRAIFEKCHNVASLKGSASLARIYRDTYRPEPVLPPDLHNDAYMRDLRPLEILGNKLKTVDAILKRIAGLPPAEEPIVTEEPETRLPNDAPLVEQLIHDPKTFYAGALIERIWSGLNIPFHSVLPSEQPLGGVSDLTNKGEFDKLLISEFANDDLVFLSRIANNEALYIRREIPPEKNKLERVVLIDASLKNWGTPKTIAHAIMLAIAHHPKTDIPCSAYVIGSSCHPVQIDTIHGVIDGLQLLETGLSAAQGLDLFFREYPDGKNREVFFITTAEGLAQPAMLKAVSDHQQDISYWIQVDADGHVDVYKKQQNSKRHMQHLLLPLEDLWSRKPAKMKSDAPLPAGFISVFPILLQNNDQKRQLLNIGEDTFYIVSSSKTLFRHYPNVRGFYGNRWEVVVEKLGKHFGHYEIGRMTNGDHVLLAFTHQDNRLRLINLTKQEETTVDFTGWRYGNASHLVFHDDLFYCTNGQKTWSIAMDGTITPEAQSPHFARRREELKNLINRYAFGDSVLRNVSGVFLNQAGNLVFNRQELLLQHDSGNIMLSSTGFVTPKVHSVRKNDSEFHFHDGSVVEAKRCGLFILRSSSHAIPPIFVPAVVEQELGVATESVFSGNELYFKHELVTVFLEDSGPNKLAVVKLIKEITGDSLARAKTIVDGSADPIGTFPVSAANKLRNELESTGARVRIVSGLHPATGQQIMETRRFFNEYVAAFTQHILDHGTQH